MAQGGRGRGAGGRSSGRVGLIQLLRLFAQFPRDVAVQEEDKNNVEDGEKRIKNTAMAMTEPVRRVRSWRAIRTSLVRIGHFLPGVVS